jgi:hypothetical protein
MLALAIAGAAGAACAGGRSLDQNGPTRSLTAPSRPTVSTVSQQAQAEIRACPDNSAAVQCVADALTRYATALQAASR